MSIRVYYNQLSLSIYPAIARRLKFTPGQPLSSIHQAMDVLNQNATHQALVEMAKQRSLS
ncbi:hypothetical protein [Spirosoma pulveris]